jgi:hypothetical protein
LTTRLTSLQEILGDKVTYLETLSAEDGADVAWSLFADPEKAHNQVEAINNRALFFTWRRVAELHRDFYKSVLEMPPRAREVAELWMADSSAWLSDPPARSWPDRLRRAFIILRDEGLDALLSETKQFIEWRRA